MSAPGSIISEELEDIIPNNFEPNLPHFDSNKTNGRPTLQAKNVFDTHYSHWDQFSDIMSQKVKSPSEQTEYDNLKSEIMNMRLDISTRNAASHKHSISKEISNSVTGMLSVEAR
jgi:hypothetical protein